MIKKILILGILVGLAYGAWKYMEQVHENTAAQSDKLKPSEKALREEMEQ